MLPTDAKAVTKWLTQYEGFVDVIQGNTIPGVTVQLGFAVKHNINDYC